VLVKAQELADVEFDLQNLLEERYVFEYGRTD
jgi:hypothetical protein